MRPHRAWQRLDNNPPGAGESWVLLFHPGHHRDPRYPGLSVTVSNCAFAQTNAKSNGYSHWAPIPYPLPLSPKSHRQR